MWCLLDVFEREAPRNYRVHMARAVIYLRLRQVDDARAAVEKAVRLASGADALRALILAADVEAARGDRTGERAVVREIIARAEKSRPPYARARVAAMQARLDRLDRLDR